MVVRTWRKISAPGRLGQSNKNSPSNVPPAVKINETSPESRHFKGSQYSRRRTVSRQLFYSPTLPQRSIAIDEGQESTPGELAINYLLLEFSTYAHWKIEKALKTVNYAVLVCSSN